jgi:hypothetical protein
MEKPEHEDIAPGKLVAQQVATDAKFANLARIEVAKARPASGETPQCFRGFGQPVENGVSGIEIVLSKERVQSVDVTPSCG